MASFNLKEKKVIDLKVLVEHPDFEVTDGYHSFKELYEHRIVLYIALCKFYWNSTHVSNPKVWRSQKHSDGSNWDGWFILGIGKDKGRQITYHLPNEYWDQTDFAETLDQAPEFDGHAPEDVINRLNNLI